jgi:hypothetical protein
MHWCVLRRREDGGMNPPLQRQRECHVKDKGAQRMCPFEEFAMLLRFLGSLRLVMMLVVAAMRAVMSVMSMM